MELKEIGRFNYHNKTFIVLKTNIYFHKKEGYYDFYLTIKGYGSIVHVFGISAKDVKSFDFNAVKNYVLTYIKGYYEEITGEVF